MSLSRRTSLGGSRKAEIERRGKSVATDVDYFGYLFETIRRFASKYTLQTEKTIVFLFLSRTSSPGISIVPPVIFAGS